MPSLQPEQDCSLLQKALPTFEIPKRCCESNGALSVECNGDGSITGLNFMNQDAIVEQMLDSLHTLFKLERLSINNKAVALPGKRNQPIIAQIPVDRRAEDDFKSTITRTHFTMDSPTIPMPKPVPPPTESDDQTLPSQPPSPIPPAPSPPSPAAPITVVVTDAKTSSLPSQPTTIVQIAPSSSSNATVATTSLISTLPPSTAHQTASSADSSLFVNQILAVVIPGGIVVLILSAIIVWLLCKKRRTNRDAEDCYDEERSRPDVERTSADYTKVLVSERVDGLGRGRGEDVAPLPRYVANGDIGEEILRPPVRVSSFDPSDVITWSPERVSMGLATAGMSIDIIKILYENGVDGPKLLQLDHSTLISMGFASKDVRELLLIAVRILRDRNEVLPRY
ncbi:hypothetical protein HDU97_001033 [Phlyctochytrium planicorne]|nr:hypothetical protein HDU97_001033 [Phlyctochytrium planicorne]